MDIGGGHCEGFNLVEHRYYNRFNCAPLNLQLRFAGEVASFAREVATMSGLKTMEERCHI